jgi:hypothetical protein
MEGACVLWVNVGGEWLRKRLPSPSRRRCSVTAKLAPDLGFLDAKEIPPRCVSSSKLPDEA